MCTFRFTSREGFATLGWVRLLRVKEHNKHSNVFCVCIFFSSLKCLLPSLALRRTTKCECTSERLSMARQTCNMRQRTFYAETALRRREKVLERWHDFVMLISFVMCDNVVSNENDTRLGEVSFAFCDVLYQPWLLTLGGWAGQQVHSGEALRRNFLYRIPFRVVRADHAWRLSCSDALMGRAAADCCHWRRVMDSSSDLCEEVKNKKNLMSFQTSLDLVRSATCRHTINILQDGQTTNFRVQLKWPLEKTYLYHI